MSNKEAAREIFTHSVDDRERGRGYISSSCGSDLSLVSEETKKLLEMAEIVLKVMPTDHTSSRDLAAIQASKLAQLEALKRIAISAYNVQMHYTLDIDLTTLMPRYVVSASEIR